MIMDKALTVTQINTYIKHSMDADEILNGVFVKGEISNFKHHYSGHMYMSLKDDNSVIRAVMFKGSNMRLRFMPENGMSVIAGGRISVYERDGQYQLYIEEMIPEGTGDLYAAYEQLKKRLSAEGLFDSERKKTIPEYPSCVGVITSGTGAAVRDIINVISRRYKAADIIVYPVPVQGEGASVKIAKALKYFDDTKKADVIIVGRGGGSIEDLWAFNEEITVRAVAECSIPVISAVGHETDFTLCDFAADLRAPTPSAAAELAVPDMTEVIGNIEYYKAVFSKALVNIYEKNEKRLELNIAKMSAKNITAGIDDRFLRLDSIYNTMYASIEKVMGNAEKGLILGASKLDALSPLKVLTRGYAIAQTENGKIIKSSGDVKCGDDVSVLLRQDTVLCRVIDVKRKERG